MTNTTMNKTNKYEYLFVLQGHYGQGWEDLCASESSKEIRQNRKEYRENEGGTYRIIQRREARMVKLSDIIAKALATA
jgi:hypothetical protein